MSETADLKKPPKEFIPIDKPEEAEQLLQEATRGFVSAIIWSKNQKFMFRSNFKKYDKNEGCLVVATPANFDHKLLEMELGESKSEECYFSVSLSWANIFFKSKYIAKWTEGIRFEIPTQLYKVQRRKDLRLRALEGLNMTAELDDPAGSGVKSVRKLFDLSASGLSLLAASKESVVFGHGLTLTNISFLVGDKKVMIPRSEVRHCKEIELEGKKFLKVGVLFREIREADSSRIASYVFEETRKFFLKFV